MKEFLKLNKSKLLFAYKLISISCLCICFFFIVLAKVNQNQFPETKLLIQILVFAGIILPILIVFVISLSCIYKIKIYKKYVLAKVYKQNNNFGYTERLTNENSKWSFTEKVLVKTENGFEIQIEIVKNNIEFWIFATNHEIEKNKLEYFEKEIRQLNIQQLFYGGFYVSINRKKLNEDSLKEIESTLSKLIELLIKYDFKSVK